MFENLPVQPGDPILQMMQDARADTRADKIDLSVGVYCDEAGHTPIMQAVKLAERRLLEQESTKAYLGVVGDTRFNALVTGLALGESHPSLHDQRVGTIQTTGGSAALRIAAELLKSIRQDARIWVSDPTWGNHIPLLKAAGLQLQTYAYYDRRRSRLDFAAMCEQIRQIPAGDILLLHGSCHNPTGADLSLDQWREVIDLVLERDLLPFVDAAYHGMGAGFEEDALGFRMMAERVPEMLLAYSASKNFGLYRDRAGALISISRNAEQSRATLSNLMSISRVVYSMPPAHGAWLVAEVLSDQQLRQSWLAELEQMRLRIADLRRLMASALTRHLGNSRFDSIAGQQGMFSLLGLELEQVRTLRRDFGIYMLESSRINLAGARAEQMDRLAASMAAVLGRS